MEFNPGPPPHHIVWRPSPWWLRSPAGWTLSGPPRRASDISGPRCSEPRPLASEIRPGWIDHSGPKYLNLRSWGFQLSGGSNMNTNTSHLMRFFFVHWHPVFKRFPSVNWTKCVRKLSHKVGINLYKFITKLFKIAGSRPEKQNSRQKSTTVTYFRWRH